MNQRQIEEAINREFKKLVDPLINQQERKAIAVKMSEYCNMRDSKTVERMERMRGLNLISSSSELEN